MTIRRWLKRKEQREHQIGPGWPDPICWCGARHELSKDGVTVVWDDAPEDPGMVRNFGAATPDEIRGVPDVGAMTQRPQRTDDLRDYLMANMFDGDEYGVHSERTSLLLDRIVENVG